MRKSAARPGCAPAPPCGRGDRGPLTTYAAVVDDYIRTWRPRVECEREPFRHRSLKEAIEYAALSMLCDGKRHPHQYRLKREVLAEGEGRLQKCAQDLQACGSFDELHELVRDEIGGIGGIGPLTIYDVAERIGTHLGSKYEPELVYLHAGTAAGAEALGLDTRRESLNPSELPPEFRPLRPREIEDCLCLYKGDLRAIRSKLPA
jgi:hypothetical protein